ncbi:plasmid stability protein [Raoultella sp. BIGb0138]|uniref:plasmid partitioning/stability family protein n=1 Tax=Raoultella sp. BIGb0138 TaxID=2485115 RepID=UPI001052F8A5|nr:plasmid partitioning/stability family protein [Raoultella sp. BIGb0138]TCW12378.1 plasmid stability protein [Raoultella sp. BIGb0138]
MTLERRKVLIYLRPDISASERFADAKIEAHHRGDRGEMSRTALLAGLALGEIDGRLPSMLAALLAEDTRPEMLRTMLASFLEIQPAVPAPAPTAAPAAPVPVAAEASAAESISARNLAGSLPD